LTDRGGEISFIVGREGDRLVRPETGHISALAGFSGITSDDLADQVRD
jgi:hypothetical protein